ARVLPLFRHSQHGNHLFWIVPHICEVQLLHLELEEWLDAFIKHLFPVWSYISIHDAFKDKVMHARKRVCRGKPSNLASDEILLIQECKNVAQVDKVLQNVVCTLQVCWEGDVDPVLCLALDNLLCAIL